MRSLTDVDEITDDELWQPLEGSATVILDHGRPTRRTPPRREPDHAAIQEAFEQFHENNPRVYDTLVRLARQYRAKVGGTPGIGMLWEVMRWTVTMETRDVSVWKLNNSFRSRYARRIMEQEPDLSDAFETRRLRAA